MLPDLRSVLSPEALKLLTKHGLLDSLIERMLVSDITNMVTLTEETQKAAINNFYIISIICYFTQS